jgi:hypothetical protein
MTRAAAQCREYIEDKWPGVRISRQSSRDTASGFVSQHSAYQPGDYDSNALDIMGGPTGWTREQNIELIQAVVDDLTPYLHEWSARKILWKVPLHYGHAHIDFYPSINLARWCSTRGVTPAWRYSDGHIERQIDPAPENGEYHGEDNMKWSDIVADATWAKAYEDGFIQGDPAVMPDYYFAGGPATEDEKKNAYNVIMQNQMEATK